MYTSEINRKQPASLLVLIDQSFSMSDAWAGTGTSIADQLALAVNRLLGNAVVLCSKGDDRIHDYFEVGVLGYGGDAVEYSLHGTDSAQPLLPIGELARNPKRVDQVMRKISDGAGGVLDVPLNLPVWVDSAHNGKTPMVKAFQAAERILSVWCGEHPDSFPPIVINLTDGMSTDGDPSPVAETIREAETSDGHVLLFNLHLSATSNDPITLPDDPSGLPDDYARRLFAMSSALPISMLEAASGSGYHVGPGARGFLYNSEATAAIDFLDIGTRAVTPTGLKELTDGRDHSS